MAILQRLNDQGITIILVTHEPDIATYCKRVVLVKDGRVIWDQANANRRLAVAALASQSADEPEAAVD
jgi:putative ABC transport system ATP-binding protein